MKKSIKITLALMLAAVFALALPLNALAITYSGTYNGYYYAVTGTGSGTSVHGSMTYQKASMLRVELTAVVYYDDVDGVQHYVGPAPTQYGYGNNATSASKTYTYAQYYNVYHNLILGTGYFGSCSYDFYVGPTSIFSWSMSV